jgi:hypothetical protein
VIEVAVRQQDRLERDARALDRRDEALGLLARIDHDRGARLGGGTHEVAVLLQRPDGQHPDVEHGYVLWARRWRRL